MGALYIVSRYMCLYKKSIPTSILLSIKGLYILWSSCFGRGLYIYNSRLSHMLWWESMAIHRCEKQGWNSQLNIGVTKGHQPVHLPCIMGFAHNTIWRNLLCPRVARVERGWISAFSILPGPIKVDENHTIPGCVVQNVGVPQVPKDNIVFMKETHCVADPLGDDCTNWYFVLS